MGRLVINGEEVYELDEECLKEKNKRRKERAGRSGFGTALQNSVSENAAHGKKQ